MHPDAAIHPTRAALRGISSMATRALLADLAVAFARRHGTALAFESVGGVEAARRVAAGEAFDLVALAAPALDGLAASGHVGVAARITLGRSGIAVAVPAGAPRPAIGTEAALRDAVCAAPTIGCSTGPSGTALRALLARWGLLEELQPRLVQVPPGEPVAAALARGEVALGFQQLGELLHAPGIALLGLLPAPVQSWTPFDIAVGRGCMRPDAAHAALAFLASPELAPVKQRHGMAPA